MRTGRQLRWALILALVAMATGCSAPRLRPMQPAQDNLQRADRIGECARLYRDVDAAVIAAGVADAEAAVVPGLPYLRLNRFLAAVAPEPDSPAFAGWVDRLRALDRSARQAELANLPDRTSAFAWARGLETCGPVLRNHDLGSRAARARLAGFRVPDEYQPLLRLLGAYPLVSIPFLASVRRLHRETRETFAIPLDRLPVRGTLRRLGPEHTPTPVPAAEVAELLAHASDNPLHVPEPGDEVRRRLLHAFAPVWEVDTASADDLPGHPQVAAGQPPVVAGDPVVYAFLSHARWQERNLLQLNYVLWFPARPRQGPLDLAAGRLDGITWRVTLGPDGRPLLYDSVHNCGCYHKLYPTRRATLRTRRRGWEEPISVPQTIEDGAGRVVLRISAADHYVQRVYHDRADPVDVRYRLADYQHLRTLPAAGGGRRSLFRPDGIVSGSERRERWLFWPMGIPEPGAMRQRGTHAIAFVGRRHFDDPELLERYFAPAE